MGQDPVDASGGRAPETRLDAADAANYVGKFQPDRPLLPGRDFIDFYGRSWLVLLSYARRYVKDSFEAEEVVQDAFLKLFIAMPELENEGHAMAYLRRTVQNLCIDRYRKVSRRPFVASITEEHHEIEDENSGIDPIVAAEDAALIREALAKLKWEHREALIAWEIEGKSTAEIAERIGVDEKNVKHTLNRARAALRRLLVGTHVDPTVELSLQEQLEIAGQRLKPTASKIAALVIALGCYWQGHRLWTAHTHTAEQASEASTSAHPTTPSSGRPDVRIPESPNRTPVASARPSRAGTAGAGQADAVRARPHTRTAPDSHPAPAPSRAVLVQTAALRAQALPRISGTTSTKSGHGLFGRELRWNYSVLTNRGVIVLQNKLSLDQEGLQLRVTPIYESHGYLVSGAEQNVPAKVSLAGDRSLQVEGRIVIDGSQEVRIAPTGRALSLATPAGNAIVMHLSVSSDLSILNSHQIQVSD